MYWASSVDQVTEPIAEVIDSDPEPEQEETDLGPGSYLIFQSVRTSDEGDQDWANDDTEEYTFYRMVVGEEGLVPFITIEHGPKISGGLTSYVYGEDILMHRYQTEQTYDPVSGRAEGGNDIDGVLSLTGEILETRPENWQTFRSANGQFEVTHDFGSSREQNDGTVTITDVETGEVLKSLSLTLDSGEIGYPEPYLIDNSGTYLFVHQVFGGEATLAGLWEVNLQTGESQAIHELVDLQAWNQASVDPESRRVLAVITQREPSDQGPYDELLPPTTVQLLDLESGEVTTLFTDDTNAYDHPYLDSPRQDRYLLRPWKETNEVLLFGMTDDDIQEAEKLVDGWVLDWVGDWLILGDGFTTSLFNIENRGATVVAMPEGAERFEYVGSVVID